MFLSARMVTSSAPVFCMRCGRRRLGGEYGCPACGGDVYGTTVPGDAVEVARTERPVGGVLGELLRLPDGAVVMLHGPRGSGKTSLALQAFERPHVASSEMEPLELLDYARRLGVKLGNVSMIQVLTLPEPRVDLGIPEDARDVVVDSLTATHQAASVMAELQERTRRVGGRAIVIVQHRKDDEYAGSAEIAHAADVEVEVLLVQGARTVRVLKNRFGALGNRAFRLAGGAPESGSRGRYYSVEGRLGDYRLVPHPSAGARHAAYLLAVERALDDPDSPALELPPPPCAVAALPSRLYRGGWIEPEDRADRARYADAHGVPYFSPCGDDT